MYIHLVDTKVFEYNENLSKQWKNMNINFNYGFISNVKYSRNYSQNIPNIFN